MLPVISKMGIHRKALQTKPDPSKNPALATSSSMLSMQISYSCGLYSTVARRRWADDYEVDRVRKEAPTRAHAPLAAIGDRTRVARCGSRGREPSWSGSAPQSAGRARSFGLEFVLERRGRAIGASAFHGDFRGSTAHTEEKGERRVQVRIRMIKRAAVAKQKQN